jgi:methyl-accepting chemotaxis protein-1 (serine sensor receptor)
MNNLNISTRLKLLIGVLSALLLGVGSIGLLGISHSNSTLKTVYEDRVVALDKLGAISYLIQRNSIIVMEMLIQPSAANVEAKVREIRENVENVNKTWAAYKATYLTPEEERLVQKFELAQMPYLTYGLLPAVDAMLAGNADGALAIYNEKIGPVAVATHASLLKLNQLQVDVAKDEYEKATTNFEAIRVLAIGAIVAGVLFAVAFGFSLERGIGRQLGCEPWEAASLAESVARGNLATNIIIRPGDSSSLMAQLKLMQQSLARVVAAVRLGADSLATASAQIAGGNSDLSSRTESQASALEQTAASMEQLSATVNQNADSARLANQLAKSACTNAVEGGDVMVKVVETMKGINESSRKISDIISVIDGIAFQTNILALNAAVEAARAGEQGRGFAVVASEVRSLAGRSAEAAKEIKCLINASVERVAIGTLLVDEAGVTMGEVVAGIRRVTDLVGEISSSSKEQSLGVAQINEAITELDQVTQKNAALVEEMAAASGSLNTQAQDLVSTMVVFKLEAGNSMPYCAEPTVAPVGTAMFEKLAPNSMEKRNSIGDKRAATLRPTQMKPIMVAAAVTDGDWTTF